MDKRADTSNGSGGTSRTVVTSRRDDDDLTAASDQPAEIVTTDENGKDRPVGAVADPVPAMPADSIRPGRSSGPFTFNRSASVPVTPEADGWQADDHDATAPAEEPAGDEPAEASLSKASCKLPAATGTGWPSDGTTFGGPASTEPSAEDTSPAPEPQARAFPRLHSPGTRRNPPPPRRRLRPGTSCGPARREAWLPPGGPPIRPARPRQARRRPRTLSRTGLPSARPGRPT